MIRRLLHRASCVLPFFAVILVVTQLVVSNGLVSAGRKTQLLDREIADIGQQNEDLRQKLAFATSLSYLETKAAELGFIKSVHTLSLSPADVAYHRAP